MGREQTKEMSMGRKVTAVDADTASRGVMVYLVPDEAASEALMEASGATETLDEQHITLAYLGSIGDEVPDTEVARDQVTNIVGGVAVRYAPLHGEANGWGIFHNEQDVLVALWNIPGINGLRQRLVEDLRDIGHVVRSDYSFTPHQTMAYADSGTLKPPGPVRPAPESVFGAIYVEWGDETIGPLPLSGVRREAAPARGGNPDNPGQFSTQDKGYRKKDKSKTPSDSKGDSGGGSQQDTQQDTQQEAPGGSQDAPGGSQEAAEPEGGSQDQETASEPMEGYTGVTYDPEKESFTQEERIAHGDVYGHFLPEGRYPKGDPRNEPEFERRMAEKTDLTEKYLNETLPGPGMDDEDDHAPWWDPENQEAIEKWRADGEGGQTMDLHDRRYDPATGKTPVYSPERARVHQEIIAKLSETYQDYPRDGKAIVMAGPPGAGKSSFLNGYGKEKFGIDVKGDDDPKDAPPAKNFVTLNPDDFKELLPVDASRYPGLEENELAAILHEESSYLSKRAVRHFMSQGYNVIIDVTLGNASKAVRDYVAPYGDAYDYQVALVDGTMENSLNNAGLRYKKPDKETGVRSYGGRFLPMGLIEVNAPSEGSEYRSKNAEQFTEFIKQPGVSLALVYDPDTATISEAKSGKDQAPVDWVKSRPTSEAEPEDDGDEDDEGLAAAANLVRQALSSILRAGAGGGIAMKRFGSMVPAQSGEITAKIVEYRDGRMTLEDLVDWLVNHEYAPAESGPKPGTPEWYEWHQDQGVEVGTYQEVVQATDFGLLSWEDFQKINDAMSEASKT